MNILLWIVQSLVGLFFIFAGVMKFVMPVADMQQGSPVVLPGWFFHFIGACEILGGMGLILPSVLRIKPGLTPLAAALLAIIMIGAIVVSAMGSLPAAAIPFVNLLLLSFIAVGRWRLRPIAAK